jgi:hypothetical protein
MLLLGVAGRDREHFGRVQGVGVGSPDGEGFGFFGPVEYPMPLSAPDTVASAIRKTSREDFQLPSKQNLPRKGEKKVHKDQIGSRTPLGDPRTRQESRITRVGYEVG